MKRSKQIMQTVRGLCLCLLLMVCSLMPLQAEEDLPSRAVYVVYDDSGSMYQDYDKKEMVDTWSKAKYSMEVFASMIAPEDTMKIFYMSDYSKDGSQDGARIELSGQDLPADNVRKIHDERTASGQPPFETVEAAYDSLEQADADEKWLVVLTDGDFQKDGLTDNDKSKVTAYMDDFFSKKDPDVNVAFLAMGESTVPITENREENIFFSRASNSDEILDEVMEISNRIFNTNRLDVAADSGKFSIDEDELLIIEDSVMDLGLLEVIEDQFFTILSIIQDVLTWQLEQESEASKNADLPVSVREPGSQRVSLAIDPNRQKRNRLIRKLKDCIETIAQKRMSQQDSRKR